MPNNLIRYIPLKYQKNIEFKLYTKSIIYQKNDLLTCIIPLNRWIIGLISWY